LIRKRFKLTPDAPPALAKLKIRNPATPQAEISAWPDRADDSLSARREMPAYARLKNARCYKK
jgi:hypothetical protein